MICSKVSPDRKQYLKLDRWAQRCCGSRRCGNTPKPTLSSCFADNLHCRAPTQQQNQTLPTHSMKTPPMHHPPRKEVIGLWNVLLASFGPYFSSRDSISVSYKKAGIYLLIYLQTFLISTSVILEENWSTVLIEQPRVSLCFSIKFVNQLTS